MKKPLILKVVFATLSIAFIGFTIFNWISDAPTKEMYRNQIEMVQTFAEEAQISEQHRPYTASPSTFLIDPFLIDSTFILDIMEMLLLS